MKLYMYRFNTIGFILKMSFLKILYKKKNLTFSTKFCKYFHYIYIHNYFKLLSFGKHE